MGNFDEKSAFVSYLIFLFQRNLISFKFCMQFFWVKTAKFSNNERMSEKSRRQCIVVLFLLNAPRRRDQYLSFVGPCEDKIPTCFDYLARDSTTCNKYLDWSTFNCRRTCGICHGKILFSDETKTSLFVTFCGN